MLEATPDLGEKAASAIFLQVMPTLVQVVTMAPAVHRGYLAALFRENFTEKSIADKIERTGFGKY